MAVIVALLALAQGPQTVKAQLMAASTSFVPSAIDLGPGQTATIEIAGTQVPANVSGFAAFIEHTTEYTIGVSFQASNCASIWRLPNGSGGFNTPVAFRQVQTGVGTIISCNTVPVTNGASNIGLNTNGNPYNGPLLTFTIQRAANGSGTDVLEFRTTAEDADLGTVYSTADGGSVEPGTLNTLTVNPVAVEATQVRVRPGVVSGANVVLPRPVRAVPGAEAIAVVDVVPLASTDVTGWNITLAYDPALLTFNGCVTTGFVGGADPPAGANCTSMTAGQVSIASTTPAAITAVRALAGIRFVANANATPNAQSALTLTINSLTRTGGAVPTPQILNGTFIITPFPDVNSNNVVNSQDLTCLQRITSNLGPTAACPSDPRNVTDINLNGVVNTQDLTCLQRYTSGLKSNDACPLQRAGLAGGAPPPLRAEVFTGSADEATAPQAAGPASQPATAGQGAAATATVSLTQRASATQSGVVEVDVVIAPPTDGDVSAWTLDLEFNGDAASVGQCAPAAGGTCNTNVGPGLVRLVGLASTPIRTATRVATVSFSVRAAEAEVTVSALINNSTGKVLNVNSQPLRLSGQPSATSTPCASRGGCPQ